MFMSLCTWASESVLNNRGIKIPLGVGRVYVCRFSLFEFLITCPELSSQSGGYQGFCVVFCASFSIQAVYGKYRTKNEN